METKNNLQKKIGISIGVVVILGILYVTFFLGKQNTTTSPSAPLLGQASNGADNSVPLISTTTTPVDTPKNTVSVYKDGTYSATGSLYFSRRSGSNCGDFDHCQ